MSFHKEGFAAVYDKSGAYHITMKGKPLYSIRYIEAFGYYGGIATVRDKEGYFHINIYGKEIHNRRFKWSGNFQEGLCVVYDSTGFFHIDKVGRYLYSERYKYTGDFKYGIAVVYNFDNQAYHIINNGGRLNNNNYHDADVYHKGFAVVKDDIGYYHVNKNGS